MWENGYQMQVGVHAGRRITGGESYHYATRVSAFLDWIEEVTGVSY